jgi:hypothetical protein
VSLRRGREVKETHGDEGTGERKTVTSPEEVEARDESRRISERPFLSDTDDNREENAKNAIKTPPLIPRHPIPSSFLLCLSSFRQPRRTYLLAFQASLSAAKTSPAIIRCSTVVLLTLSCKWRSKRGRKRIISTEEGKKKEKKQTHLIRMNLRNSPDIPNLQPTLTDQLMHAHLLPPQLRPQYLLKTRNQRPQVTLLPSLPRIDSRFDGVFETVTEVVFCCGGGDGSLEGADGVT